MNEVGWLVGEKEGREGRKKKRRKDYFQPRRCYSGAMMQNKEEPINAAGGLCQRRSAGMSTPGLECKEIQHYRIVVSRFAWDCTKS